MTGARGSRCVPISLSLREWNQEQGQMAGVGPSDSEGQTERGGMSVPSQLPACPNLAHLPRPGLTIAASKTIPIATCDLLACQGRGPCPQRSLSPIVLNPTPVAPQPLSLPNGWLWGGWERSHSFLE